MYWPIQPCAALRARLEFGVDNNAALRAGVFEVLAATLTGRRTYNIVGTALWARESLLHIVSLLALRVMPDVSPDYTSRRGKSRILDILPVPICSAVYHAGCSCMRWSCVADVDWLHLCGSGFSN